MSENGLLIATSHTTQHAANKKWASHLHHTPHCIALPSKHRHHTRTTTTLEQLLSRRRRAPLYHCICMRRRLPPHPTVPPLATRSTPFIVLNIIVRRRYHTLSFCCAIAVTQNINYSTKPPIFTRQRYSFNNNDPQPPLVRTVPPAWSFFLAHVARIIFEPGTVDCNH